MALTTYIAPTLFGLAPIRLPQGSNAPTVLLGGVQGIAHSARGALESPPTGAMAEMRLRSPRGRWEILTETQACNTGDNEHER